MAASTPIPIILCGKTEQIGQGVIEGLKPEFEGMGLNRRVGQTDVPEHYVDQDKPKWSNSS